MLEKRFVLGVDLDGVCADFYGGLREVAAEWLGKNRNELTKRVRYGLPEWRLEEAGGYVKLHRFAVVQRELFKKLKPFRGAPITLRRLSTKGVWIRIITHRLFIKYFHQEAARQTIEWLDFYDIPYWDLCFVKEKVAVGANLYVEDSPDNVKSLRADGQKVLVFGNSTNVGIGPPRANSWEEVERYVLHEYRSWRSRNR